MRYHIVKTTIVLISTYWNVNFIEGTDKLIIGNVLISTYWNVNNQATTSCVSAALVLISTYWNVN